MKALLIRVGIDQSKKGGRWNAPVDPESGKFVFVPIPDSKKQKYRPGLRRRYGEVQPALDAFADDYEISRTTGLGFPQKLRNRAMHLDPDFEYLSYGGGRQAPKLKRLKAGDLVVFFSGLKPITRSKNKLDYAIIGIFVVKNVDHAAEVTASHFKENAHTRWRVISGKDVIVRGVPKLSGRLERSIVIGEWRDGAYRLTKKMDRAWGGLEVKNGFLQKATTPWFTNAKRFHDWFRERKLKLVAKNF